METVEVKNLDIIVTENCNLHCSHCLRGEPRVKNIDNQTIDNIFNNVTKIKVLNITGGEPLLAPSSIERILDNIKTKNISLDSFVVVTNGTVFNQHTFDTLKELDRYTKNRNSQNSIVVSTDDFHNYEVERKNLLNIRDINIEKIQIFAYENNFFTKLSNYSDEVIIDRGRARNIEKYTKENPKYEVEVYTKWLKNKKIFNGSLVIDTEGNVFTDADSPYEIIRNFRIGNINEDSLFDCIEKRSEEEHKEKEWILKR